MAESDSHSQEDLISPATDCDEPSVVVDHGAESLDPGGPTSVSGSPDQAIDDAGDADGVSGHSEALAKGISTLMTGIIRDFDSKAMETSRSQDQVSCALDRLSRELDQLLEDAPVPFIMQHAARISGVRKRVSSMNLVLKAVQRRLDNIDRMLTLGLPYGHEKPSAGGSKLP